MENLYQFIYDTKENKVYSNAFKVTRETDDMVIIDVDDESIYLYNFEIGEVKSEGSDLYLYTKFNDVNYALEVINDYFIEQIENAELALSELRNAKAMLSAERYRIKEKYPNGVKEEY